MCRKGFDEPSILKRHMLFHSDERQYSCDVCEKAFRFAFKKDIYACIQENGRIHVTFVGEALVSLVFLRNISACIPENVHTHVMYVTRLLELSLIASDITMCILVKVFTYWCKM